MVDLAVVIPTYGRADKLEPLLENIAEATPPIYRVLFVVDPEDDPTWDVLERLDADALEFAGTFPQKTNAGVAATSEPWALLAADDVRFHESWFEAAMAHATEGVGVVGTNDLHNPAVQAGEYATQILVARWYIELGTIDEPGKVFWEGYRHNEVDRELCETAKARGAYVHASDSVIEHLHFTWGKSERDATYERGCLADPDGDAARFRERQALWA